MKVLNLKDVQQVSGGDFSVSVTSHVPDAEVPFFANALTLLLTGQLDAVQFGTLITDNAAAITNIPIQSIKVGNFMITPV